jgi:hypothetical protein
MACTMRLPRVGSMANVIAFLGMQQGLVRKDRDSKFSYGTVLDAKPSLKQRSTFPSTIVGTSTRHGSLETCRENDMALGQPAFAG